MASDRYNRFQLCVIAAAVVLMFGTGLMRPLWGLTSAGFRVFGILIGGLLLWLFVSMDWTSFLILMALMTVPELGVKTVVQASFGNDTAVFLLFCFMLAASLTKTGLARRISIWFITNRISRRSPWRTIIMYFSAEFILSLVLSSTTVFMIFLPIMEEILQEVGYQKGDKTKVGAMMVLGTVIVGQLANSCTPVSHAMSITGLTTYQSYTGGTIDFFTYCAVLTPLAVICLSLWLVLARVLFRPDVSAFQNIDFDALEASCGRATKREKIAGVFYIIVVVLWVLPGLMRYAAPGLYTYFSGIHQCYPPLAALFIMNLVRVDGKKILPFQDAFRSINWNTFVFIATIMALGSCFSDPSLEISSWFSTVLTPVVSAVDPIVFMTAASILGIILTNFISNAVALAVLFAVAMPLCMNVYTGAINPMAMAILITASIQYAWATPASTPNAGVALDTGWIDSEAMMKYGFVIMGAMCIVFAAVGIPLATFICG